MRYQWRERSQLCCARAIFFFFLVLPLFASSLPPVQQGLLISGRSMRVNDSRIQASLWTKK